MKDAFVSSLPDVSSVQPQRSSVAQPARSSIVLMPCSPNATSINAVSPGMSLSSSATPSSFRLASKLASICSAKRAFGSGGAGLVSTGSDNLLSRACRCAEELGRLQSFPLCYPRVNADLTVFGCDVAFL